MVRAVSLVNEPCDVPTNILKVTHGNTVQVVDSVKVKQGEKEEEEEEEVDTVINLNDTLLGNATGIPNGTNGTELSTRDKLIQKYMEKYFNHTVTKSSGSEARDRLLAKYKEKYHSLWEPIVERPQSKEPVAICVKGLFFPYMDISGVLACQLRSAIIVREVYRDFQPSLASFARLAPRVV